jgi:hypothetical protein
VENQQTFEDQSQMPPSLGRPAVRVTRNHIDALQGNLGNHSAQKPPGRRFELPSRLARVSATSRLEELKARHFTVEGKAERVARSLAALNHEDTIQLTTQQWRRIAEDPDIEDQF